MKSPSLLRLFIWIGCFLLPPVLFGQPVVSNVRAQQGSGDQAGLVMITYDLASPAGPCTVTLRISADGGASFNVPAHTLSGAIGPRIAPGPDRVIIWDAHADWPGQYSPRMRFRVIADDGVVDVPQRVIALSGDLSFGEVTVGQTVTRTLTLSNTGNTELIVTGIMSALGFEAAWAGVIPAGESREVPVTFAPSVVSSYSGVLTVSSDATGGLNQIQVSGRGMSGGGTTPAGMVLVEAGVLPASSPLGAVAVSTFYIGRYEVTWGEWQEVRTWASANGYDIGSVGAGCADDHPVHSVAWYDVVKWSNAKSEMEGLTPVYTVSGSVYRSGEFGWDGSHFVQQNLSANGYRLPLEAEWEFAARGGNQSNGYTYSGSNDLNAVGWHWDNANGAVCNLYFSRGTWPVGQKAPNELGLHDMSGNVWEWCWDQTGSFRPIRGGSWSGGADNLTVSSRNDGNSPMNRGSDLGFRLARTPES